MYFTGSNITYAADTNPFSLIKNIFMLDLTFQGWKLGSRHVMYYRIYVASKQKPRAIVNMHSV